MKSFSVIVLGKNDEAHLTGCLRSALAATAAVGDGEVVYVDAASTDHSVALAQVQLVPVLALRPTVTHPLTAGRYVGFHHTTGELLMFVDGSTQLEPEWLCRALAFFTEAAVAGVAGYLHETDAAARVLPAAGQSASEVINVSAFTGSAVYRRAALAEAGPFEPQLWPQLWAEDEAAVAQRLRQKGWQLLHVPFAMGQRARRLSLAAGAAGSRFATH